MIALGHTFRILATALCLLPLSVSAQGRQLNAIPGIRIGSDNGEHDAFGVVSAVTVKSNIVYIADRQANSVIVFDIAGKYLRTLGRKGSGPGEFQAIETMGWLGDSLYIVDRPSSSVSLFANGLKHTVTYKLSDRHFRSQWYTTLPLALLPGREEITRIVPFDASALAFLARYNAEGVAKDTIFKLIYRNAELRAGWSKGSLALQQPFSDHDLVVASDDGYSYRVQREFAPEKGVSRIRVTQHHNGPSVEWSREFTVKAQRLPADTADKWVASISKANPMLADPEAQQGIKTAMYRPTYYAPVTRALVGVDGRLWLRLASLAPTVNWMVINLDGTVAGHVVLPAASDIAFASRDEFWIRQIDADAVWFVQRYSLKRQSDRNTQ